MSIDSRHAFQILEHLGAEADRLGVRAVDMYGNPGSVAEFLDKIASYIKAREDEADQLRGDMSVLRLQRDSARAESQHIIEAKNAEIDRLRLTDAEREAVAYYVGTGGPEAVDSTLRGLLERLG